MGSLVTISWLQLLLPEPRKIRMPLRLSSRLLLLMLRSGVLVIPRYSLELVFWVTWKRFVKTGLVKSCLGFKLKQEANNLALSSRSFKIKSFLSIVCKEPSETTILVRPGSGGNCGWISRSKAFSLLYAKNHQKLLYW